MSEFTVIDAGEGLRTLERGSVSTIITSPPYFGCRDYSPDSLQDNELSANFTGKSEQLGHEATPFQYVERLADIFGNSDDTYLKEDGSIWIVIGDTFAKKNFKSADGNTIRKGEAISIHHLLVTAMRKKGWRLWQEIIWMKPSVPPSGATRRRCNPCHEYILVFCNGDPVFYPSEIREEGKTPEGTVMPPVGGKKYGDYKKTIVSDGKRCRQDVWTITPSRHKGKHVAPFPEEIPRLVMLATTKEGDVVCDPFAGTLTTSRVADKLGRKCISFDIYDYTSPHDSEK